MYELDLGLDLGLEGPGLGLEGPGLGLDLDPEGPGLGPRRGSGLVEAGAEATAIIIMILSYKIVAFIIHY